MALKKEDEDFFRNNGEYFGYPECCIVSFSEMIDADKGFSDLPEVQKRNNRDGFTPCIKCCEKIEHGDVNIEDLIDYDKRKHRITFQGRT